MSGRHLSRRRRIVCQPAEGNSGKVRRDGLVQSLPAPTQACRIRGFGFTHERRNIGCCRIGLFEMPQQLASRIVAQSSRE